MNFKKSLRLGLAGALALFTIGCTTPSYPREDLAESGRKAIVEIKQARIDSHYVDLARRLEKYDLLFFGETHPVGVSDSKLQSLGRVVPLLKVLTDPRIVERPYRTIIVESLPATYDFTGSRIVPFNEQRAISEGKFNSKDTPFLYEFTHLPRKFNFNGVKSSFGPVHGVESLEDLIKTFAGTGVEIRGSLPNYGIVSETFEKACHESVIYRFNNEQAGNELVDQLSRLVGKTTLSAVYASMNDSLSLGIKPRIIIFGGKMHNDSGSPKAERDPSYKFVSLREELSSFSHLRYGAVDIVNFATDDTSNIYDYLLQRDVSNIDLSAKTRALPTLINSNIRVFSDNILIFGEK